MADVKVPQRMNPQDIVKWLIALRRALKARVTKCPCGSEPARDGGLSFNIDVD
jgi:hypothetical protein